MAVNLLSTIPYIIIPHDKDAGYAFIHIEDARALELQTLNSEHYRPVAMSHINFDPVRTQFVGLARDIEQCEQVEGLAKVICKPLERIFPTHFGYTVKAHKPQGKISTRPLHKAWQPALIGFSTWLVSILKPILNRLSHVIRDSFEFRDRVQGQEFPDGFVMAVVDVKDFHLPGTPLEVSNDVASVVDGRLTATVRDVIYNLMDNQIVFAAFLQAFYKCFHGTGMGLVHSGHCSNLAFFAAVERNFIHRLGPHGIKIYTRYHDDIFMVFSNRLAMRTFLTPLVRNSAYFK